MKRWIVDISMSGSYQVIVEAETKKEAIELAQEKDIEEFLSISMNDISAEECKD